MADLSYDDVRKILALVDATTLDELHLEFGDFKLDVRRRTAGAQPPPAPSPPTQSSNPGPAPVPAPISARRAAVQLSPGQFTIAAPMLGTFYCAPAPGAPPFVEVGRVVAADDPLCIIEVMKLMNTIKAEREGRVSAILVQDASMVEFGQPLIVFDPA